MKTKNRMVGSFEAKTNLSGLLDYVRRGNEIIITKRGKPVAKLIPYPDSGMGKMSKIVGHFSEICAKVRGKVNIKNISAMVGNIDVDRHNFITSYS